MFCVLFQLVRKISLRSAVSLLYHLSWSVVAIISILHPYFSVVSFTDGSMADSEVTNLTLSVWLPPELLGCLCTMPSCDFDVGICNKDIPFGFAWICLDLTGLVLSLSICDMLMRHHQDPPHPSENSEQQSLKFWLHCRWFYRHGVSLFTVENNLFLCS